MIQIFFTDTDVQWSGIIFRIQIQILGFAGICFITNTDLDFSCMVSVSMVCVACRCFVGKGLAGCPWQGGIHTTCQRKVVSGGDVPALRSTCVPPDDGSRGALNSTPES